VTRGAAANLCVQVITATASTSTATNTLIPAVPGSQICLAPGTFNGQAGSYVITLPFEVLTFGALVFGAGGSTNYRVAVGAGQPAGLGMNSVSPPGTTFTISGGPENSNWVLSTTTQATGTAVMQNTAPQFLCLNKPVTIPVGMSQKLTTTVTITPTFNCGTAGGTCAPLIGGTGVFSLTLVPGSPVNTISFTPTVLAQFPLFLTLTPGTGTAGQYVFYYGGC